MAAAYCLPFTPQHGACGQGHPSAASCGSPVGASCRSPPSMRECRLRAAGGGGTCALRSSGHHFTRRNDEHFCCEHRARVFFSESMLAVMSTPIRATLCTEPGMLPWLEKGAWCALRVGRLGRPCNREAAVSIPFECGESVDIGERADKGPHRWLVPTPAGGTCHSGRGIGVGHPEHIRA